jgi:hypothetical protein
LTLTSIAMTFGGAHLPVEELDDATQLVRDLVGDEHHAELPGAQVLTGARPELLHIGVVPATSATTASESSGIALALAEEDLAQLLERPVDDAVGGIFSIRPTTSLRIRVLERRLTSTIVGTASWSRNT